MQGPVEIENEYVNEQSGNESKKTLILEILGGMLILKQESWKMGEQRTQDTEVKMKKEILELLEVNVYREANVKKGRKAQKRGQRYKYISWH